MTMVGRADLEPGMVLAEDLIDAGGRMLLPAGATIRESHLPFLEKRNVEAVNIVTGVDEEEEALLTPEILDAAADYTRQFFQFVDHGHEGVQEVFRQTAVRVAKRLAQGWKPPSEDEIRCTGLDDLTDIFFRDEGGPSDIVSREANLVAFPDIYFRIREELEKPHSSAESVSRIVGMDPALTARLLKLVNSPLFGMPSRVDSIARAVALLGSGEVSTLALGVSVINCFEDIPQNLMDMRTFWKHSMACAIFARLLGMGRYGLSPERLFVGGLLHDVGRLVLFRNLPQAMAGAMIFSRSNSVPLHVAEQDALGFDHACVGGLLLAEWSFPEALCNMIRHHHEPMTAPNVAEAAVLQTADLMASAAMIPQGGMYPVPQLQGGVWDRLELNPPDVTTVMVEFDQRIGEMMSALF